MSEDDRWSDVIHQVLDALNEANVDDPQTRDALADGVRQALESLESGVDLNIELMGTETASSAPSGVAVEVVDGGRTDDSPPTEGKKPTLRIAEPAEEAETTPRTATDSPFVTQVKILQGDPLSTITAPRGLETDHGWISINNDGGPDGTWQTVYQGLRARLYRIACLPGGRIDVTVDGAQVERLAPGQSVDVEGLAIRVTSPDEQCALGTYLPIPTGWSEE